ncbi:cupredoxin domain-containing protein [Paenibacillus sp. GCM10012307]|uniref:Cupredoxin domain-containing protein n=1 Tax=Paenibacillus roseus TaxID=2798579 RepID=A0A934J459_9BACL|nr:cupredoxin domain-containing protein [Paenibacillus roseus]MBJ6361324.1 cupredoxin domain-containing protein [Paenibacillus roseus]
MSKIFVVSKKQFRVAGVLALAAILACGYLFWSRSESVSGTPQNEQVYHLVTGEFKTTTDDGSELEVYRFDPGTIYVRKGEPVQLNITGINGKIHPFIIEGLNIKGEVQKGKVTTVRFTADQPGTYPIVCLTHTQLKRGGPMVGYIVVQ